VKRVFAILAVIVGVVVLVGLGAVHGYRWLDDRQQQQRRQAREEAIALMVEVTPYVFLCENLAAFEEIMVIDLPDGYRWCDFTQRRGLRTVAGNARVQITREQHQAFSSILSSAQADRIVIMDWPQTARSFSLAAHNFYYDEPENAYRDLPRSVHLFDNWHVSYLR